MSNKAILITGGGKRVGALLCEVFAQNGYDIALHYNASEAEAKSVKKKLESLGAKCELFQANLADIAKFPALMASVKEKFPHCSALINNASIFEPSSFMETDEALFERQIAINFKAPFFLTQAFAKQFGKGSVVNILDTDIVQSQGSHFIYLQSKKMLADFTLMAARELGPEFRVNAVCPGPLNQTREDQVFIEKLNPSLPLRACAALSDIAQTVFWLSNQSSITGQLIFVDGGKHVL